MRQDTVLESSELEKKDHLIIQREAKIKENRERLIVEKNIFNEELKLIQIAISMAADFILAEELRNYSKALNNEGEKQKF